MKVDKFIFALIGSVILAWIFPRSPAETATIVLKHISTVGIGFIFFFYGLKLSPEKIKLGLGNWRLHLLVQSTTFILFPLVILIFYPLVRDHQLEILWLGLFFLAALPSTVSFSVIMTSIGRGNIPASIFNASISGIIGILVTPLWMGLFLQQRAEGFDFSEIYIRLILQIILPVTAGMLLQPRWHSTVIKYSKELNMFDKSVILIIIYNSFARSFGGSVFSSVKTPELVLMTISLIALLFIVYGVLYIFAGLFKFNREDKITALFCGSTKSLVHGSVFAGVLFSDFTFAGIMLLPLMLYHAMQIFFISIIANRYGSRQS